MTPTTDHSKRDPSSTDNDDATATMNDLVAVLYQSTNIQQGCGHVIPWRDWVRCVVVRGPSTAATTSCPICQSPVGMVMDGTAATATSLEKERTTCANGIIYFKNGKCVYQLSTTIASRSPTKTKGLFSFVRSKREESTNEIAATTTMKEVLAQDRIVQALQLVEDRSTLKILCKGKVLYPPPPSSPASDEATVSQALLEISAKDLSSITSNKPSLVVMGTRQEELQQVTNNQQTSANSNAGRRGVMRKILRLPLDALFLTFQVTWLLVGTFVSPFLPPSWTKQWKLMGNSSNNGSNDEAEASDHHRHRD